MSGISPTQAPAPTAEVNNAAPAPAATAPSSGSSNPASNGTTPAPSTGATASSSSSTGQDESLICRWDQCKEPFTSAEALYVSHIHPPMDLLFHRKNRENRENIGRIAC
jgi:hypothetical protein